MSATRVRRSVRAIAASVAVALLLVGGIAAAAPALANDVLPTTQPGVGLPDHGFQLLSQNTDGQIGDNTSTPLFVSQDLRYVAFQSQADNLVLAANDQLYGVHWFIADTVGGTLR